MRNTLLVLSPVVLLPALAVLFVATAAPSANAQPQGGQEEPEFSSYHPSSGYTQPSYAPTPATSINRHTSTVVEATGRAIASIMKAQADGLVSQAQAAILMEEAIARHYQNRVNNTETFLHRRRLLDEAKEAERLRAWEWEAKAQARRDHRSRTVLYAAYKLPATRLDPLTGNICWPQELEKTEFTELIADLDALFGQLAEEGAQYDRLYRDPIVDVCNTFRDQLLRNRERLCMSWDDYLACQKMIAGLKYGAEYWPEADAKKAKHMVASTQVH